jgi:AmmeMemoRadiSam system protein A
MRLSTLESRPFGGRKGAMVPLSRLEQDLLLDLARRTLDEFVGQGRRPAIDPPVGGLAVHRASFVTLRIHRTGELRGCRGETRATRPLAESVVDQTIAAASDDPRFEPVERAELTTLSVHISALGPLEKIAPEAIELGRHGLLILHRLGSGLLLPQVPRQHGLKTANAFLAALCRKAQLPEHAWLDPGARLFGFE